MKGDGSYWNALLRLLYPERPRCALCQQPFLRGEEVVCASCVSEIRAGRPPFCRVCGRELQRAGICTDCVQRGERFFLQAVAYGPYAGRLRELLLRLKQERREELVSLLAVRLAEAWAAALFDRGVDWLVPVPMAADKLQARGFNQAERLATALGQQVGMPICHALTWQGQSRSQAARDRRQRLASMEQSLVLSQAAGQVADCTVCLVDDVYTTGATANACAKRLHEAGARVVYVLTVAR